MGSVSGRSGRTRAVRSVLAVVALGLTVSACAQKDPFGPVNPDPTPSPVSIGDFGPGVPVPSGAAAGAFVFPVLDSALPVEPYVKPTKVVSVPGGIANSIPHRAVGTKAANTSGSGKKGSGSGGTTTVTNPTVTNPFIAASTAPAGPSLAPFALTAADVGNGAQALTGVSGSSVTGGTSLSLCGGSFPSESLRTARLLTTFATGTGTTLATNEVVQYSGSGAAQAFGEVKTAAGNCPKTGAGATTVVTPTPASLGSSAIELSISLTASGPPLFVTAVYQVVGNTLGITNVYRTAQAAAQAEGERLGAIEAGRL
jgi:hypothetical protein